MSLTHIKAKHENDNFIENGIDMSNYTIHDEWDVMKVYSEVDNEYNNNNQLEDVRPFIKFTMVLRRKTIFYTVSLIIPCVSMAFLTVIVFGLPSESG